MQLRGDARPIPGDVSAPGSARTAGYQAEMIVVFGANGRTGVEIVRAALARNLAVRPVCRDNRDQDRLLEFLEQRQIFHADPDRPRSLAVALEGATTLVSALEPRTLGAGAFRYHHQAAEHVLSGKATRRVHLSVVGANRWSLDGGLRAAGFMEFGAEKVGASIFRVSCYHDELREGAAHPKGRYSPISRQEAGTLLLDWLQKVEGQQKVSVGGPRIWECSELSSFTSGGALLPGRDVSVSPSATLQVCGTMPMDRLEDWKPPQKTTRSQGPEQHPADDGADIPTLYLSTSARKTLYTRLLSGFPAGTRLSFEAAIPIGPRESSREGELTALEGVQAISPDGTVLKNAPINYFYDDPSRQLFYWWNEVGIPRSVWDSLDVVARKKLKNEARFAGDPGLASLRA